MIDQIGRVKEVYIDGVPLVFPIQSVLPPHLHEFPTACGAGRGLGDAIIPERPVTVRFSPACRGHDDCWKFFPPEIEYFTMANNMFLQNMETLTNCRERLAWVKMLNMTAARTYYAFVSGPIGLSVWCGLNGLDYLYTKFSEELFPDIDS